MEPIPVPLRKRIIERYDAGDSTEEIAQDYGYCVAAVRRVRQRHGQTGSLAPKTGKVGRKPALDEAARVKLAAEVAERPDATLAELKAAVGVEADISVYCRTLRVLALTRKKSRSTPPSKRGRT